MENFAKYLERLMRQKHLSAKELSRLSGITDSYIGRICKGEGDNLTVETIVKLAKGLDVNAHEVFTAASGIPVSETPPLDPLALLDVMQKLIADQAGFDLLQQLASLPADRRKVLLDYLQYARTPGGKGKPRQKTKRKYRHPAAPKKDASQSAE